MTDTKRVDELEVGDIVIFAGCKGISTISSIETKVEEGDSRYLLFVIFTEETEKPLIYLGDAEVTYLGNKKEEKMEENEKITWVDNSAFLYPYFDSLANEEVTLKHTNIPVYVRQQLKHIHELFEDVLGLTLGEVKSLYFERKKERQESQVESKPKTKKAKDLCIGDKIFLFLPFEGYEGEETITKLQEFSATQTRIITDQGTEVILRKDKVISLID